MSTTELPELPLGAVYTRALGTVGAAMYTYTADQMRAYALAAIAGRAARETPAPSMSMFASRADYEASRAAEPAGWIDVEELLSAAQAVVARWDTPLWKDAPFKGDYINRLRKAIVASEPKA